MKPSRFLPAARTSHAIAWGVWALFAVNCVRYVASPFIEPRLDVQMQDWTQMFIYVLIIVSVLEAAVTIMIRHFAIVRPYKRGTYNPHDRFTRYFIVGVLNWFVSNTIALYGPILYYMSGIYWPHYILGSMAAALLLYHSPRLGPFTKEETHSDHKEANEATWAKVE